AGGRGGAALAQGRAQVVVAEDAGEGGGQAGGVARLHQLADAVPAVQLAEPAHVAHDERRGERERGGEHARVVDAAVGQDDGVRPAQGGGQLRVGEVARQVHHTRLA